MKLYSIFQRWHIYEFHYNYTWNRTSAKALIDSTERKNVSGYCHFKCNGVCYTAMDVYSKWYKHELIARSVEMPGSLLIRVRHFFHSRRRNIKSLFSQLSRRNGWIWLRMCDLWFARRVTSAADHSNYRILSSTISLRSPISDRRHNKALCYWSKPMEQSISNLNSKRSSFRWSQIQW